jgi:hypothetical protein
MIKCIIYVFTEQCLDIHIIFFIEQQQPVAPLDSMMTATPVPGTSGEQTTLITNENEAFALEPLDTTHMPGKKDTIKFTVPTV